MACRMLSGDSSFHEGPPMVAASPKPLAPSLSHSCTITGLWRWMAPNESLCGRIVGMSRMRAWMRSMRSTEAEGEVVMESGPWRKKALRAMTLALPSGRIQ